MCQTEHCYSGVKTIWLENEFFKYAFSRYMEVFRGLSGLYRLRIRTCVSLFMPIKDDAWYIRNSSLIQTLKLVTFFLLFSCHSNNWNYSRNTRENWDLWVIKYFDITQWRMKYPLVMACIVIQNLDIPLGNPLFAHWPFIFSYFIDFH